MNGLHLLIKHELDLRGWSIRELSIRADIPASTLYKIMNHPEQIPSLATLDAIHRGLHIPLTQLVEACGYSLASIQHHDDHAPLVALLRSIPRVRRVVELYCSLDMDQKQAFDEYVEFLAARNGVE